MGGEGGGIKHCTLNHICHVYNGVSSHQQNVAEKTRNNVLWKPSLNEEQGTTKQFRRREPQYIHCYITSNVVQPPFLPCPKYRAFVTLVASENSVPLAGTVGHSSAAMMLVTVLKILHRYVRFIFAFRAFSKFLGGLHQLNGFGLVRIFRKLHSQLRHFALQRGKRV